MPDAIIRKWFHYSHSVMLCVSADYNSALTGFILHSRNSKRHSPTCHRSLAKPSHVQSQRVPKLKANAGVNIIFDGFNTRRGNISEILYLRLKNSAFYSNTTTRTIPLKSLSFFRLSPGLATFNKSLISSLPKVTTEYWEYVF